MNLKSTHELKTPQAVRLLICFCRVHFEAVNHSRIMCSPFFSKNTAIFTWHILYAFCLSDISDSRHCASSKADEYSGILQTQGSAAVYTITIDAISGFQVLGINCSWESARAPEQMKISFRRPKCTVEPKQHFSSR